MIHLGPGDPLRLGPYRLLGVLGEGGMGKVYVGQDSAGTFAAVKVLRPELAHDTHLAQRFVREAHAAQAVRGKGVAAVLGAQTEGGRPWIAAEFLAGPTLDEAISAYGPFDEAGVRALAVSIARTLTDIHAAGLIHRDLKPPNIVLTSNGPRIIDFGIARPEHGLTLTTTGQTPVTPGYGAPEQVLGQRVTPSADVFSLGALLVYAASGRRAYDGPHVAAVQYEVVHGQPQLHGLPAPLQALIAPCLAKDPAARPAPAQIITAFAAPRGAERVWLRGAVAGAIKEREEQVKQLNTLTASGAARPVSRRGLITVAAAGGVVLASGGGATAWWLRKRAAERDPFFIPPAARTPKANLQVADEKAAIPETLWTVSVVDVDSPVLLPVRDVIVFGSTEGGIAAHDVRTGELRWNATDMKAKSGYVSLSDRLIAAADADGTLHTFVASTGEPKWTVDAGVETLLAADAQAVYLATKDGRLRSVRCSDAGIRWTAEVPAAFRGKLQEACAIGHGRLIIGSTDCTVLAVDTGTGRRVWDRKEAAPNFIQPVISGGAVYLNGKQLSASKVTDGMEMWTIKSSAYGDEPDMWGPPVVLGNTVYAVDSTNPMRLSTSDGHRIWTTGEVGSHNSPMLVQGSGAWWADGTGDDGVTVKAAHRENGAKVWAFSLPDSDYNLLTADGNRVFVANDHMLVAYPTF